MIQHLPAAFTCPRCGVPEYTVFSDESMAFADGRLRIERHYICDKCETCWTQTITATIGQIIANEVNHA